MKLSSVLTSLSSAFLLGSSLVVGAAAAVAEKPTTAQQYKKALFATRSVLAVPRGGAGPLNPTQVAQTTATGLLGLHVISALGPKKALQSYGIQDPSPETVFVAQREWTFFLAGCLSSYLMLVHDKSVNTAIGYGTFPLILDVLRSILNDEQEKLGISNWAQLLFVMDPLVVNAYVCLTDMEIANTVTMICGAYNLVKGIWYFLDTENSGKTWGLKGEYDPIAIGTAKWMGISVFVYGAGLMALSQGVDPVKLMGYSWVPVVLHMAHLTFITKAVDKYGLNKSLYITWMILGTVVIGTLAFD